MIKKILPRLHTSNDSLTARWHVEYRDAKNKRIKKYGDINRFTTIHERNKAAQKLIQQIIQASHDQDFNSLANTINDELEKLKPTWRRKTYQCKKSKVNTFLRWMKSKPWTEESIHDFFFILLTKTKRVANTTYNDYILVVGQALDWCRMKHLLEGIDKRKANPTPASYFTDKQRNFLATAMKNENPDLWFFVQFVYYCFLRPRSELRVLKVGDVILEDRKILVPAHVSKNKKQQYVAIPDAFFDTVNQKIKNRPPNEYLFPGLRHKQPTGMNTYGRQHRELLIKLGLDTTRFKLYSWKHTGAVAAVRAGIHIKQLQIQLRHHSLDQVDAYLRQLGVNDLGALQKLFPSI